MYYVYILRDEHGKTYVGYSDNLKNRLQYHTSGSVKTTRQHSKPKLAWYCAFPSKKKALDFEKYLKEGSGHAFTKKRLLP